jgi:hypothetical protein
MSSQDASNQINDRKVCDLVMPLYAIEKKLPKLLSAMLKATLRTYAMLQLFIIIFSNPILFTTYLGTQYVHSYIHMCM